MTAGSRAKKIKSKVEGQGHKVILKVTKCVAADVDGLHVDMTAQAYVFHLLFTPITPCIVYDQHICLCADPKLNEVNRPKYIFEKFCKKGNLAATTATASIVTDVLYRTDPGLRTRPTTRATSATRGPGPISVQFGDAGVAPNLR